MLSNFNYYGFLVGLATVVAIWWWEKIMLKLGVKLKKTNLDLLIILFSAVLGARVWHILTDWHLYSSNFWQIFAIWNGGLSVLGALVGLGLGSVFVVKIEKIGYLFLLDTVALALPFAQAIGRWGNYFNQELYGLPSNLPWSIMINGQKVHPLFLYESILMLLLGIVLNKKLEVKKIGMGLYFFCYLYAYLVIRFFLDYLRVQKTMFSQSLGLNQVIILLGLIILSAAWLYRITYGKKY